VFLRSRITKPAGKYMENKGVIDGDRIKIIKSDCRAHDAIALNKALICTSATLECFSPIASPTISTSTNGRRCFHWASPLA